MFDMLTGQYKNLASKGRYGDTMLAHINPQEVSLLQSMGGAGTTNPQTGLREFFNLEQLLSQLPPLEPLPSLGQALSAKQVENVAPRLDTVTTPATSTGGLGFRPASVEIAPQFDQYADKQYAGMGGVRVTGYTVPTEQTFSGKPLEAKYDASGNFQHLGLAGGAYLPTDPNQPNIVSSPRINAKGQIIDYGIFDLSNQDNGSFGSFLGGFAKDFGPMILAGLGANLAAGSGLFGAGGASSLPLGPYVSQAAGAYGGSAAAAAAAAAGNLAGIQTASGIQNAVNLGIPTGGPADFPTTQAATTTAGGTSTGTSTGTTTDGTGTSTGTTTDGTGTSTGTTTSGTGTSTGTTTSGTGTNTGTTTGGVTTGGVINAGINAGTVGTGITTALSNPTIAGTLLGAITSAVGSAKAPTSTTTTSSIDPQIKAEYLANLERARQTAAGLEARQIAQPGKLYTDAEQQLYNLGMTPFGATVTPTAITAATTQPSSGNVLTPEIARTLMQRSMTTGLPYSESDKYGGYAAVKAMYDKSGGDYSGNSAPYLANDIARFFNPFENQVVTNTLGDIERTRMMQEQANRDQATRARAFGGSRQGVVTGMTNEAAMRQAANTAAQLRSAGFTQAANLGLAARPLDIAGLQTSLGLGTARTALEQARLDALRNLGTERLGITSGALGLQPANVGGTTSTPLYSNTAGSLLSGGLTGAYIGSLLQPNQPKVF